MLPRLIRRSEVQTATGLGRSAIYALMSKNQFPRPVRIGERAVAWRESDIKIWIAQRSGPDPVA